ncbi:MAG: competence/damage-inducible protein A, partial [Rhodospirillaceae bacterium]|nr:competence/damage-inducible protein A [Rhodospirillaceae bacterium]
YPWHKDGKYGTSLVLRGTDPAVLDTAYDAVFAAAAEVGGDPVDEPSED